MRAPAQPAAAHVPSGGLRPRAPARDAHRGRMHPAARQTRTCRGQSAHRMNSLRPPLRDSASPPPPGRLPGSPPSSRLLCSPLHPRLWPLLTTHSRRLSSTRALAPKEGRRRASGHRSVQEAEGGPLQPHLIPTALQAFPSSEALNCDRTLCLCFSSVQQG